MEAYSFFRPMVSAMTVVHWLPFWVRVRLAGYLGRKDGERDYPSAGPTAKVLPWRPKV